MLDWLIRELAGADAENLVVSHWGFGAPIPNALAVLCIVVLPALGGIWYWRRLDKVGRGVRAILTGMRVAAFALLIFLALDPSIIARLVKPGEQFVALLFDDSRSMRIGGNEGRTRGERLVEAYTEAQEGFEEKLKQRHRLVSYRLGENLLPLPNVSELRFDERESNLVSGVSQALRDLEGVSVSAVVLFSDGVQQGENSALELGDLDSTVPIFTVGVDSDSGWHDLELNRLVAHRTEFDKSPVEVTLGVESTGLIGREAYAEVTVGDRTIASKRLTLDEEGEEQQVRLSFIPDREGWIEYEAHVRLASAESTPEELSLLDRIEENNTRRFIVDNRDKEYRILYVSGRPNWENKFVRRALEFDEELDLSSLIMISNAERKFEFRGANKTTLSNPLFEGFEQEEDRPRYDEAVFLRINVPQGELPSGYPDDEEELFAYDMIVLGDIERGFLTTTQLELSRAFVEKRGGSVLALGGPKAFSESGFAGTILENMMPVVMHRGGDAKTKIHDEEQFIVKPTMEGLLQGSWAFDRDELENHRLWEELPPLYGLNSFALVRAGATVMAVAESEDPEISGSPLFAIQRYGEGRSAVLATSDTWQWQLRMESEDERHERFWRQLVRSLVLGVPQPVQWRDKSEHYTRETLAQFDFVVRDAKYDHREGLQTLVSIEYPDGTEEVLPVEESIQETGVYSSEFMPEQEGLHTVTLTATNVKGEVEGRFEEAFLVEDDRREFRSAQYNEPFLSKLAVGTGGTLFDLDRLDALAEAIPLPAQMDDEPVVLHLWHLPIFYILLVGMWILEWYLRRRRGQA